MRSLSLALLALFLGCTITVKPLPVTTKARKHHHHRQVVVSHKPALPNKPARNEQMQIVDAEWMANYKHLESEFDHSIPADEQIRASGTKFSVPQAVIDHFGDMIRAVHPSPY